MKKSEIQARIPALDITLLGAALVLMLLGWVMITSASLDYANYRYQAPFYYFIRHGIYLVIAALAGFCVFNIPVQFLERNARYLLLATFTLLIIILLPGVGHTANNATRWLALGPFSVQVSELAKIGVVIYLSSYLVRQTDLVRSKFLGFVNPMVVIIFLIMLLLLQPDFGAVIVLLGTSLGMLFLGGVRIWQFTLVIVAAALAVAVMVLSEEYRMNRLVAYLDPWAYQQGGGYQLIQSLIAIGRGEWLGLGLGNSIQKLFFLPEAHTDFIFAVLAEELGLLGCIATLAIYTLLIGRMLMIAHQAEKHQQAFSAYVTYGIAIIFSMQLFINVGVSIGLLPTKGLTLPFLSYGGSSLLVSVVFIALVLRINYEMSHSLREIDSRQGTVMSSKTTKKYNQQSHYLRGANV